MALYAIGDTHLSLSSNKPMDVFGGGWEGYVDKLQKGFAAVGPEDTVVLCGNLSWGMSLEEAKKDFAFLDALPGARKLLLKGNHDYWWNTAAKMNRFFAESGFSTLRILHNNCYEYGGYALCGTRGWFYEETGDQKVFKRGADPLGGVAEGGGGAAQAVLSPLSAPLPGLPLSRDHCPAGAVRRGALLLRPSPRRQPPLGRGRTAGRRGLLSGLRRLCGVSPAKNL